MEWFFGVAALPLLMCGLMCVGGIALAALGLRRGTDRAGCHTSGERTAEDTESTAAASR